MRRIAATSIIVLIVSGALVGVAASAAHRAPVNRRSLIERGAAFLLESQKADGSYGNPLMAGDTGITALCARSLAVAPLSLNPALAEGRDAAVERATRWLLARQARDGSFASGGLTGDRVFQTTLALRALAAVDWTANTIAILGARRWLESRQIAEGAPGAGGWADQIGAASVLDTELALLALRDAGASPTDASVGRGAAFLTRAQRPDGSFAGDDGPDSTTTWAGVLGLLHAGVHPSDSRVDRGLRWLRQEHRPRQDVARGRFRCAFDVARAQSELGSHADEWLICGCHDAIASLAATQKADGSWENEDQHGTENVQDVATGHALDALALLPEDDVR